MAAGGAAVGLLAHERWPSLSAHVVAVMVGVVIGNSALDRGVAPVGLRFAARHVLRLGIVVLGLRLSMGDVVDLGPGLIVAVVIVVACTFLGTQAIGRALGLGPGLSLLVATGYSICGASAIAAAEPFADASEAEVAYSIGLVTLCGSLAIAVLPVLGTMLGLPSETFGAWVGASVHDVGQVVAAASTRDATAVEAAVVVKLTTRGAARPAAGPRGGAGSPLGALPCVGRRWVPDYAPAGAAVVRHSVPRRGRGPVRRVAERRPTRRGPAPRDLPHRGRPRRARESGGVAPAAVPGWATARARAGQLDPHRRHVVGCGHRRDLTGLASFGSRSNADSDGALVFFDG